MNYPYPQYQQSKKAGTRGLRRPDAPAYSHLPGGLRQRRSGRAWYPNSPWVLFFAAAAAISFALLPFFLLGGTYLIYQVSGRIFPGVTAGPVSSGDLTQAGLAQKIDAWNRQKNLVLTDGVHAWPVSPQEIGLRIDPQATAARAYQVGRNSQMLGELIWLVRFGNISVQPVILYDPRAARTGLEKWAAQINQPARDATLRLENGQWTAVPGQNGASVNIDQTLQNITAQPGAILNHRLVPLATQPVAPRISDLAPELGKLQAALKKPFKLQAYDPITNEMIQIPVPGDVFASWVTVSPQAGDAVIGLNAKRLSAFLDQWKASLGPARTLESFTPPTDLATRWQNGQPVTAIVYHNPTTYTVQGGDTLTSIAYKIGMPYWKIQQANPGMDPNQLVAGQILKIPSKNDMLPLPIVLNKRIIISISQQRLWTYENGAQTGEHVISTGIDRSPTIPGIYQVRTHEPNAYASVWDLYMPSFIGIYEGWPGFMNGIHGLPTLSNGTLLWAGYLGRPVSYGCIILGLQEAQDLYNWAKEGVIVEIRP